MEPDLDFNDESDEDMEALQAGRVGGSGDGSGNDSGTVVAATPAAPSLPTPADAALEAALGRMRNPSPHPSFVWAAPYALLFHKEFKSPTASHCVTLDGMVAGGDAFLVSGKSHCSTQFARCIISKHPRDARRFVLELCIPFCIHKAVQVVAQHWHRFYCDDGSLQPHIVPLEVTAHKLTWDRPGAFYTATVDDSQKDLFLLSAKAPRVKRKPTKSGAGKRSKGTASARGGTLYHNDTNPALQCKASC